MAEIGYTGAMNELWRGLNAEAQAKLVGREYRAGGLAERLRTSGVEVGELIRADRSGVAWIPGVEFIPRQIYPQRHRGFFGELAREEEGRLAAIGLWPKQWASATMLAGTAKGFHIHPPSIPEGTTPAAWFQRVFVDEPDNFALRRYAAEQWDVMFFLQGNIDMILVDERVGMPRHVMRFLIEGDDTRGAHNAAVVIPSGVAHALRVEGSREVIMVYGTSTAFRPEFEGRIAHEVETSPLPPEWAAYLGG